MFSLTSSGIRPGATSRAAAAAPLTARASQDSQPAQPAQRPSPTPSGAPPVLTRRNSAPSPGETAASHHGQVRQLQLLGTDTTSAPLNAPSSRQATPRSRSLDRLGRPLQQRRVRASSVRRDIERAGAPGALATAPLRRAAIARLTHPDQGADLSEAQAQTRAQRLRPELEQVIQWSERKELQDLWTSLCGQAEPADAGGARASFVLHMQAQLLELVAARLFNGKPLHRSAEISRTLEEARPLLTRASDKGPTLQALAHRLRALLYHTSREEIVWHLSNWESLPAHETGDEQTLRALVILSLRIAFQGVQATRQELISPEVFGRLSGDTTDVWTVQFHMMRQACGGLTVAESGRLASLCLKLPVPIGLPEQGLRVVLRLREFMLRALQPPGAAAARTLRLRAISSLTDLAATVHEPLRTELLMRGVEIRSLLPLEPGGRQAPSRPAVDGKTPKGSSTG